MNTSDSKSNELPEEARQCNPSLPSEMEVDASQMKGDAIGSTLYSERWVIKILMKLLKFQPENWTEDMETELCLLWDMTIEQDVVDLLMKHNVLQLMCEIINVSNNPRLTEILIGIFGNMCCIQKVRNEISYNEDIICMLLDLLSIPDIPTLLQLIRLIQSCLWDLTNPEATNTDTRTVEASTSIHAMHDVINSDISEAQSETQESPSKLLKSAGEMYNCNIQSTLSNCSSCVKKHSGDTQPEKLCVSKLEENEQKTEKITKENMWLKKLSDIKKWLPRIIFILSSSTNEELLCCTFGLLNSMIYIPVNDEDVLGHHIVNSELLIALIEAMAQLHNGNEEEDIYINENVEKAACHWATVVYAFTSFPEGKPVIGANAEEVSSSLCSHLILLQSTDLYSEKWSEFISLSVSIMSSLLEDTGYFHPQTFNCFLSILTSIKGKIKESTSGNNCEVDTESDDILWSVLFDLKQYFQEVVQKANGETLARVLQHCDNEQVSVLQSVMEKKSEPTKSL